MRWGTFSVYGVKLHLLISYELTAANVAADVAADVSLSEELLAEAKLGEDVARRVLGDLAYRSEESREALAARWASFFWQPSHPSGDAG